MSRVLLILAIILYAFPAFSQKEDVKSGTIRVVKKKYKVRRIYPVEVDNSWFTRGGVGNTLLVANLDGKYGFYAMKAEEIVVQGRLFVNSDEYHIVSFDMSCKVSGLEVMETSAGNEFSENQLRLAKFMKKGMRIYIENIKCKNDDGDIKFLGSITVSIIAGASTSVAARDPFMIASISGTYGIGRLKISKKAFVNAAKIDLADPSSKIVGFSLFCELNGRRMVENSYSDQFTPKMKEMLSKLSKGAEVDLRRIRYSTDGGPVINYGDMYFALAK